MVADEKVPIRRARRDRTKSPHSTVSSKEEATENIGVMTDDSIQINQIQVPGNSMTDASERRKSLANLTASSLLENLKETNATSITRLRRTNTTDGTEGRARSGPRSAGGGRRMPGRTLSGKGGANNQAGRRTRAENDVLSMSTAEMNFDPASRNVGMDASAAMSGSNGSRRRGIPARSRSMQDSCLPRGPVRAGRRKPGREDDETVPIDEMDSSGVVPRRRPPQRSRSAQGAVPPRGAVQRAPRPGRRRPGRETPDDNDDDDDGILISDSDEEEELVIKDSNNNNNGMDRSGMDRSGMDRSGVERSSANRRRIPQRTRSAQDSCLPRGHTGYQRPARVARRRGSNDEVGGAAAAAAAVASEEGSPARRTISRNGSSGPGLRRSNTATPPASSSGPGLMRSNTTQNPRSNRARGNRNTRQEIARVTSSSSREASPAGITSRSPSPSPDNNNETGATKGSTSPGMSRQPRRRLREDKGRGPPTTERNHSSSVEREPNVKAAIKEEPWMRRLKKNVVKSNDDSINFDEATNSRGVDRSDINNNSAGRGSSLPTIGQDDEDFFHTDAAFGVFAVASKAEVSFKSPLGEPLDKEQLKMEETGAMMEMADDRNKFDFSTIT